MKSPFGHAQRQVTTCSDRVRVTGTSLQAGTVGAECRVRHDPGYETAVGKPRREEKKPKPPNKIPWHI